MADHDLSVTPTPGGISRRTLVTGAAWAVPVMALATAAPLANASVTTSSVVWTTASAQLLNLSLLASGQPLVGVKLLPSAPTAFAITNSPGVIPNVTAEFTVVQNPGLALGLGLGGVRALRGFAPASIPGATPVGAATITRRVVEPGSFITTRYEAQDTTRTFLLGNIASGASVPFGAISWGATDVVATGLQLAQISLASSYTVTVTFKSNDTTFSTITGTINVPVNADLL